MILLLSLFINTHKYKVAATKRVTATTTSVMPEMSSTREPSASYFLFACIDEALLMKAIIPLLNQLDKFRLDVCCRAWHSILNKPEIWKCLDLSPVQHGRRTRAGYVTLDRSDTLSTITFFCTKPLSHSSLTSCLLVLSSIIGVYRS